MVTIEVTQKHIDEGIPASHDRCAVALSLSDAFPGKKIVSAFSCVLVGELNYIYPPEVTQFINAFDEEDDELEPFFFTLPDTDLNGKPTPQPAKGAE